MDPKPIEFWRERIEKNPGSVRLRSYKGVIFIPFFFEDLPGSKPVANGKGEGGIRIGFYTDSAVWTEDKPKIVRWLWAGDDGHVTKDLCTEDEQKRNWSDHTIKLEWSRTEFEA